MATFPANLKPTISRGYSFGASDNVISSGGRGGVPRQAKDYRTGPVRFNINMSLDPLRLQVWQDFYIGRIHSGSAKFNMNLDSGQGIENHIVMMAPGSIRFDGSNDPIWSVSFAITAERTPIQEAS